MIRACTSLSVLLESALSLSICSSVHQGGDYGVGFKLGLMRTLQTLLKQWRSLTNHIEAELPLSFVCALVDKLDVQECDV